MIELAFFICLTLLLGANLLSLCDRKNIKIEVKPKGKIRHGDYVNSSLPREILGKDNDIDGYFRQDND